MCTVNQFSETLVKKNVPLQVMNLQVHSCQRSPIWGEALSFWTNLPHSNVSLEGELNLPHSQIYPQNFPHYTQYSYFWILIAIIDYKWNVFVTKTIEDTLLIDNLTFCCVNFAVQKVVTQNLPHWDLKRLATIQGKYHYYSNTMCTLQDMDLNQELNLSVTDGQAYRGGT